MKQIIIILFIGATSLFFSSCESCVRKTTKKVTELGIGVLEEVSDVISEKGESTGEKVTDALGAIARGVGKSIDRLLNEHAAEVAATAGRTLIQTVEGLDTGITHEYYDPIKFKSNFDEGISLDYFGKIKSNNIIDAYFIVSDNGNYDIVFDFLDKDEKCLMSRKFSTNVNGGKRKHTVISFALNPDEEKHLQNTEYALIKTTKQ